MEAFNLSSPSRPSKSIPDEMWLCLHQMNSQSVSPANKPIMQNNSLPPRRGLVRQGHRNWKPNCWNMSRDWTRIATGHCRLSEWYLNMVSLWFVTLFTLKQLLADWNIYIPIMYSLDCITVKIYYCRNTSTPKTTVFYFEWLVYFIFSFLYIFLYYS